MKIKFVPFLLLVLVLAFVLAFAFVQPVQAQDPGPVTSVPTFEMSPKNLIELGAAILSIAFMYTPKLRTWFAGLETETKSGAMILMLALLTVGITTLACFGLLLIPNFQCTQVGIVQMIYTFVYAVAINQGTFLISPEPADVKAVKAAKKLTIASNPADALQ